MADPEQNADRIAMLREDLGGVRETLRSEIQSAKRTVVTWAVRLLVAHIGLTTTIIAGLILALVT